MGWLGALFWYLICTYSVVYGVFLACELSNALEKEFRESLIQKPGRAANLNQDQESSLNNKSKPANLLLEQEAVLSLRDMAHRAAGPKAGFQVKFLEVMLTSFSVFFHFGSSLQNVSLYQGVINKQLHVPLIVPIIAGFVLVMLIICFNVETEKMTTF